MIYCTRKIISTGGKVNIIHRSATPGAYASLTLLRFPLQRRWSELALSAFMTETKVKNGQEDADINELKTREEAENAAKKYLRAHRGSILWQSYSPPENKEDMADELSCINLNDDSLQASRELASEYSISTLVNTTCSLTHILAEENLETTVPNRFHDTLEQNDLLYQKIISTGGKENIILRSATQGGVNIISPSLGFLCRGDGVSWLCQHS
uniref:uncharacterized protein LOC125396824 n=1 Tax=Myodes glareolus TaxID=447135 RepID=UPI0020211172|nr:uncharacterized protein LOC125396824 [Myodes glareolus]XP_048284824.1 uncharacterized protein LOC125396824 [Myodes glareolus]